MLYGPGDHESGEADDHGEGFIVYQLSRCTTGAGEATSRDAVAGSGSGSTRLRARRRRTRIYAARRAVIGARGQVAWGGGAHVAPATCATDHGRSAS